MEHLYVYIYTYMQIAHSGLHCCHSHCANLTAFRSSLQALLEGCDRRAGAVTWWDNYKLHFAKMFEWNIWKVKDVGLFWVDEKALLSELCCKTYILTTIQQAFLFAKVSKDIHTSMCAASSLSLSLSLLDICILSYDIFVTFVFVKCVYLWFWILLMSLSLALSDRSKPWFLIDTIALFGCRFVTPGVPKQSWSVSSRLADGNIWSWMFLPFAEKCSLSYFLDVFFSFATAMLRFGPHEKTWCSLENQSCQMHRRTGSGTPRAVGCSVCWILVLSVSVIRKVLRASWQWIFKVKVLAIFQVQEIPGGVFLLFTSFLPCKKSFQHCILATPKHLNCRRKQRRNSQRQSNTRHSWISEDQCKTFIEGFDRELQWLFGCIPARFQSNRNSCPLHHWSPH